MVSAVSDAITVVVSGVTGYIYDVNHREVETYMAVCVATGAVTVR